MPNGEFKSCAFCSKCKQHYCLCAEQKLVDLCHIVDGLLDAAVYLNFREDHDFDQDFRKKCKVAHRYLTNIELDTDWEKRDPSWK